MTADDAIAVIPIRHHAPASPHRPARAAGRDLGSAARALLDTAHRLAG